MPFKSTTFEKGTVVQPDWLNGVDELRALFDSSSQLTRLDKIVGLTPTDGNIIVGDGTGWVAESGSTARDSLGLGTDDDVTYKNVTVKDGTNQKVELKSLTGSLAGLRPAGDFAADFAYDSNKGIWRSDTGVSVNASAMIKAEGPVNMEDDTEHTFTALGDVGEGSGAGFSYIWAISNEGSALRAWFVGSSGQGITDLNSGSSWSFGSGGTNPDVNGNWNVWIDASGLVHVKNRRGATRNLTLFKLTGAP